MFLIPVLSGQRERLLLSLSLSLFHPLCLSRFAPFLFCFVSCVFIFSVLVCFYFGRSWAHFLLSCAAPLLLVNSSTYTLFSSPLISRLFHYFSRNSWPVLPLQLTCLQWHFLHSNLFLGLCAPLQPASHCQMLAQPPLKASEFSFWPC